MSHPGHLCLCLQHKEPRGPRPVCDLLLEKLTSAESEVVQLIQDTGQAAGRDARGNRSAASIRCSSTRAELVLSSQRTEFFLSIAVCFLQKGDCFAGL